MEKLKTLFKITFGSFLVIVLIASLFTVKIPENKERQGGKITIKI